MSILQSDDNSKIQSKYQSKLKYFLHSESSFLVSPNKNIITIKKIKGGNILIFENMKDPNKTDIIRFFGRHHDSISTMVFSIELNSLLVGDILGTIIQYDLNEGRGNLKTTKIYKDLGIGNLYSSTCFRNLAFFGGNKSKVVIIDIQSRKVIGRSFSTAIKFIYSLQICRVNIDRILLVVSGKYSDFSKKKSDVFDISMVFQKINKS